MGTKVDSLGKEMEEMRKEMGGMQKGQGGNGPQQNAAVYGAVEPRAHGTRFLGAASSKPAISSIA